MDFNNKSQSDQIKLLWKLYNQAIDAGTIGAIWGAITGSLSSQADLQAILDTKADIGNILADLEAATEVGINSASESGFALKVIGEVKISGGGLTVEAGALKIPVYADNTARDSAITSPSAGMLIYNTSEDKIQYVNSALSWVNMA